MTRSYVRHDSFTHVLHDTATHCDTLQHTATHCNTLQHTVTHGNTLQHTATHCNTLQLTATHCNMCDIISQAIGQAGFVPSFSRFPVRCVQVWCSVLQRIAGCCRVLPCITVCCIVMCPRSPVFLSDVLQCGAVCCGLV